MLIALTIYFYFITSSDDQTLLNNKYKITKSDIEFLIDRIAILLQEIRYQTKEKNLRDKQSNITNLNQIIKNIGFKDFLCEYIFELENTIFFKIEINKTCFLLMGRFRDIKPDCFDTNIEIYNHKNIVKTIYSFKTSLESNIKQETIWTISEFINILQDYKFLEDKYDIIQDLHFSVFDGLEYLQGLGVKQLGINDLILLGSKKEEGNNKEVYKIICFLYSDEIDSVSEKKETDSFPFCNNYVLHPVSMSKIKKKSKLTFGYLMQNIYNYSKLLCDINICDYIKIVNQLVEINFYAIKDAYFNIFFAKCLDKFRLEKEKLPVLPVFKFYELIKLDILFCDLKKGLLKKLEEFYVFKKNISNSDIFLFANTKIEKVYEEIMEIDKSNNFEYRKRSIYELNILVKDLNFSLDTSKVVYKTIEEEKKLKKENLNLLLYKKLKMEYNETEEKIKNSEFVLEKLKIIYKYKILEKKLFILNQMSINYHDFEKKNNKPRNSDNIFPNINEDEKEQFCAKKSSDNEQNLNIKSASTYKARKLDKFLSCIEEKAYEHEFKPIEIKDYQKNMKKFIKFYNLRAEILKSDNNKDTCNIKTSDNIFNEVYKQSMSYKKIKSEIESLTKDLKKIKTLLYIHNLYKKTKDLKNTNLLLNNDVNLTEEIYKIKNQIEKIEEFINILKIEENLNYVIKKCNFLKKSKLSFNEYKIAEYEKKKLLYIKQKLSFVDNLKSISILITKNSTKAKIILKNIEDFDTIFIYETIDSMKKTSSAYINTIEKFLLTISNIKIFELEDNLKYLKNKKQPFRKYKEFTNTKNELLFLNKKRKAYHNLMIKEEEISRKQFEIDNVYKNKVDHKHDNYQEITILKKLQFDKVNLEASLIIMILNQKVYQLRNECKFLKRFDLNVENNASIQFLIQQIELFIEKLKAFKIFNTNKKNSMEILRKFLTIDENKNFMNIKNNEKLIKINNEIKKAEENYILKSKNYENFLKGLEINKLENHHTINRTEKYRDYIKHINKFFFEKTKKIENEDLMGNTVNDYENFQDNKNFCKKKRKLHECLKTSIEMKEYYENIINLEQLNKYDEKYENPNNIIKRRRIS